MAAADKTKRPPALTDRADDSPPVAVIDIGSNSIRLVVYEGAKRAVLPLFNERELCGLGKLVAANGRLGDEGVKRAITALSRFKEITDLMQTSIVAVIATAAVREAADGAAFVARVKNRLGLDVRVLSGVEEAQYAARGLGMGFVDPDGIVGDLGGGSLELIRCAKGVAREATTLPLGGLRLRETTGGDVRLAAATASEHMAKVRWLTDGPGGRFYAVGGTWRAFANLHMERSKYPLRVMHGYAMPAQDVLELCEEVVAAKKVSVLSGMNAVPGSRRDLLPFGAVSLAALVRLVVPKDVVVSAFGVREGLIHGMLDRDELDRDPLISFCRDYARLRSRSLIQSQELCDWTAPLFANEQGETDEERRLRHAACLLSDIGWRAHPDYRGEQSLNVIAHAPLSGVGHEGRAFLALTAYFRHVGKNGDRNRGFPAAISKLMDDNERARSRLLGVAIRAAHVLCVGMPEILPRCPVKLGRRSLRVDMPCDLKQLYGARVRRRFETLAEVVGAKLELHVGKRRVV